MGTRTEAWDARRWTLDGIRIAVAGDGGDWHRMAIEPLHEHAGDRLTSMREPDVVLASRPVGPPTLQVIRRSPLDARVALDGVSDSAGNGVIVVQELPVLLPVVVPAVAAGCHVVSPCTRRAARPLEELNGRQMGILAAICDECTNEQIAARTHLSLATVKREVRSLCRGLGVRGRTGLALAAREPDGPAGL